MKALILAGGSGTRLRPITHTSSKQLVPVANKPILFYALEHIAAAGITDVGMIVGDTAPEIQEAVGNGSAFGVNVTYIPQHAPLGLGHCVLIAREFLGEDDFVMYLGDNLMQHGITGFVSTFSQKNRAGENAAAEVLLVHVPDPQRFGVAELDANGIVVRLVEKPDEPATDLALVGVYLFTPKIHEAVRAIKTSDRGEFEITDAIQWLIDHGHQVRSSIVEGYWKDLGELDALLDGNSMMLESIAYEQLGEIDDASNVDRRVRVEVGASIVRSTVRGPAINGAGTAIVDSCIGPFTSIAARCCVTDAEVEHSMLLRGVRIDGVGRITDSLIGRDAVVVRSGRLPKANRLMIGDHSRIEFQRG